MTVMTFGKESAVLQCDLCPCLYPDVELRLACDCCGREYPDIEVGNAQALRYDAQIRGWHYTPHHPRPDICPRCAERTPLDDQHAAWIEAEERVRDE